MSKTESFCKHFCFHVLGSFGSQARYVGSEAPPFIFPRMAGAFEKAMVAGQKFLEGLRSLPSYKDAQQKQLRALLKQLGSVTDLTTGQSGKILSMLDEKLWDHESLQQLRQQIAAGCTTGRGRSPQPAGWLADLGNEPRLARGRDVHSCGCPDVFDPAGASCRSGRTARLAGNCTAGDVGCAPAAAGFALRRTKTAYPPLSAVVRRCPPLSAAETDTLRDVRRCPRKPRICSLRRGKPCPRLSADDETLRICEKTLVRDVRDVRRSKIYDFLFVRGLSRTFVDLW